MNTSTAPKVTKVSRKQQIIDAGRAHLREWLIAAEAHGTIYYNIKSVSRSGMNRKIALSTIIMGGDGTTSKASLVALWPQIGNETLYASSDYPQCLDIIARDWSFSFDARAFNVSGAGMDMTYALVDSLASKANMRDHGVGSTYYTNRVRRESV